MSTPKVNQTGSKAQSRKGHRPGVPPPVTVMHVDHRGRLDAQAPASITPAIWCSKRSRISVGVVQPDRSRRAGPGVVASNGAPCPGPAVPASVISTRRRWSYAAVVQSRRSLPLLVAFEDEGVGQRASLSNNFLVVHRAWCGSLRSRHSSEVVLVIHAASLAQPGRPAACRPGGRPGRGSNRWARPQCRRALKQAHRLPEQPRLRLSGCAENAGP